MTDRSFWLIMACIALALISPIVIIPMFVPQHEDKPAPYGCAWVDMNPGKGADYRLACVGGTNGN